jgi:O-antigen/teichoic acid export membrane protein
MATTTEVRATWYLVVLAGLGYFVTRPYQVYLEGLLVQSWERLLVLLVTVGQNAALLAAIVLWPRMWVMGAAFALGGWLQYACTVWLARRAVPRELWRMNASRPGLPRLLWAASWEQGVTSLGTYLVISINPLLIGWLMGPSGVAEYYLPWRAVTAAQTALIAIFLPHLPFMIEQVREGAHDVVKRRFKRLFVIGMVLGCLGYGTFVAAGPRLLGWWLHDTVPVSRAVLLSLALWQMLGVLQTICWLYIVAYGIQRFAHSIVAGAVLNVVLSIWMIPRFGVLGSVLATTAAQLLTSNWYTAWRALTLWRSLRERIGETEDRVALRNVLANGAAT